MSVIKVNEIKIPKQRPSGFLQKKKHNLFCPNVTRSAYFLPPHERHVQIFSYLFPLHYGCVFLVLNNGLQPSFVHYPQGMSLCTLCIRLYIFEQMTLFIMETINHKYWAPFLKIVTGYSDCRVQSLYCLNNYNNSQIFLSKLSVLRIYCVALQRFLLQRCVKIIVTLTLPCFLNLNMKFPCHDENNHS